MGAKGKQQINRKINLRFTSPEEGETKIYPSHMKSIRAEHLEVLAPLDIPDLSTLIDQEVTVEEEPVGTPPKTYAATIVDQAAVEGDTEDRILVLNRPSQFQERNFSRIDVNFPATVKAEVKSAIGVVEQKSYEGLSTNLSASGLLIILGMDSEQAIESEHAVTINFKLPVGETLIFTLNAQVIRKYRLEFGELSTKYTVAFRFIDVSSEVENQLVRYALTHQMERQPEELDAATSESVHDQINLLRDELGRLQEQLDLANEQMKRAEEARQRSDTIIIQLTKRLNEQSIQLRGRHSRWRFWERSGGRR